MRYSEQDNSIMFNINNLFVSPLNKNTHKVRNIVYYLENGENSFGDKVFVKDLLNGGEYTLTRFPEQNNKEFIFSSMSVCLGPILRKMGYNEEITYDDLDKILKVDFNDIINHKEISDRILNDPETNTFYVDDEIKKEEIK